MTPPAKALVRALTLAAALFALGAGQAVAASPTGEAAAAALPASVTAGPKGKGSEETLHNTGYDTVGEGVLAMGRAHATYTIVNTLEDVPGAVTSVTIDVSLISGEMAQMTALPPGVVPDSATDDANGCHDRNKQVGSGMVLERWCDREQPYAEYTIRVGTAYVVVTVSNGTLDDARRIAESVHAAATGQG